jgi:hypothetical protein
VATGFLNEDIDMRDLITAEIEHVSGAGFWADVGKALGFLHGSATQMQEKIDSSENIMLGAMSQGA